MHTTAEADYVAPPLVEVEPGVQVVADYDEPVFYSDNMYWRYEGGVWYSSRYHNHAWARVQAPPVAVAHIQRPEMYVHYHGKAEVREERHEADEHRVDHDVNKVDRDQHDVNHEQGEMAHDRADIRHDEEHGHEKEAEHDRKELAHDQKEAAKDEHKEMKDEKKAAKDERKEEKHEHKH